MNTISIYEPAGGCETANQVAVISQQAIEPIGVKQLSKLANNLESHYKYKHGVSIRYAMFEM
jgi:hypothetical protein